MPESRCTVHQRRLIDARTGGLATAQTPAAHIQEAVFVHLPGRYADWAAREGLRPPPQHVGLPAAHRLQIQSPADQTELFRDPEAPPGRSTLALTVSVDPPVSAVLWLHNGEPLELVPHPHSLRWPLQPGRHRFQAMVPDTGDASAVVEVILR